MNKYRVKLNSGRIIGPFVKEQIGELFIKGHLLGEEMCQLFPLGDWKKTEQFPEIAELILKIKAKELSTDELQKSAQILSKLQHLKNMQIEKSPASADVPIEQEHVDSQDGQTNSMKEFNYREGMQENSAAIEITQTEEVRQANLEIDKNIDDDTDQENEKEDEVAQATVVRRLKSKDNLAFDNKTIVVELDQQALLELKKLRLDKQRKRDEILAREQELVLKEQDSAKEKAKKVQVVVKEENILEMATQVVTLQDLMELEKKRHEEQPQESLEKDAANLESETDAVEENAQEDPKNKIQIENFSPSDPKSPDAHGKEVVETDIQEAKAKSNKAEEKANVLNKSDKKLKIGNEEKLLGGISTKKAMTPIVAIAFLAVAYFALYDDETSIVPIIINPVSPQINFPIPYDKTNEDKSNEVLEEGIEIYRRPHYLARIKASEKFLESMQLNFKNKKALAYLILSYSELLPDIVSYRGDKAPRDYLAKEKAGNVIFNLIEIGRMRSLSDIDIVLGMASFYNHYQKHAAAKNTIERFLKVNKNPTAQLLTLYLDILINMQEIDKSRGIVEKLSALKKKSLKTFQALTKYYYHIFDYETVDKLLKVANSTYRNSVSLLLDYARLLIFKEDFNNLAIILEAINKQEAEKSWAYFARYLEYRGMFNVAKGKSKEATPYFKKALDISESEELREKLSHAQVAGEKDGQNLIMDSKIFELIKKTEKAVKEENWNDAFSLAIQAADLSETNIQAKLLLSRIQVERGYFQYALETLTSLQQQYPRVASINFALIDTYIKAYKFTDADIELNKLSASEQVNSAEFYSLQGRRFIYSDNVLLGIKKLQEAINRDPLRDQDYYLLAQMFLKYRQYDKVKLMLNKAISLDPVNINYKILYGQVLYEMESPETAIGYLDKIIQDNKVVKEFDDHDLPKIKADMAIYYYRSGDIKSFEEIKKELEDSKQVSPQLYEAMVKFSKLEDRVNDVISYSKKLINVAPANLEARMLLGEFLLQENRRDEAMQEFLNVRERLDHYPKVLFYISKIHFLNGELEKALEFAQLEVKSNPRLEYGYILLGEINLQKKEYLEASNAFKTAQRINQKSLEALKGMAEIAYIQNNMETALDLYQKASKQDPNDPVVHRQLGYVFRSLGQGALAQESFKLYLEMAPDAKDIGEIKEIVKDL